MPPYNKNYNYAILVDGDSIKVINLQYGINDKACIKYDAEDCEILTAARPNNNSQSGNSVRNIPINLHPNDVSENNDIDTRDETDGQGSKQGTFHLPWASDTYQLDKYNKHAVLIIIPQHAKEGYAEGIVEQFGLMHNFDSKIIVYDVSGQQETYDALNEYFQTDFSDYGCLTIIEDSGYVAANIWPYLTTHTPEGLVGKPKIFMNSCMCLGERSISGQEKRAFLKAADPMESYTLSKASDILHAYLPYKFRFYENDVTGVFRDLLRYQGFNLDGPERHEIYKHNNPGPDCIISTLTRRFGDQMFTTDQEDERVVYLRDKKIKIFNNNYVDNETIEMVKQTFEKFTFKVEVYHDLSVEEVIEEAKKIHENNDCDAVMYFTYGDEDNFYFKNEPIKVNYHDFEFNVPFVLCTAPINFSTWMKLSIYGRCTQNDLRNRKKARRLLQALCVELEAHGSDMDLHILMTRVQKQMTCYSIIASEGIEEDYDVPTVLSDLNAVLRLTKPDDAKKNQPITRKFIEPLTSKLLVHDVDF